MNLNPTLYDIVEYLKNRRSEPSSEGDSPGGILIATDLGVHKFCLIDTNCPEAIKLRKMIEDAGLKWQDLVAEYVASREPPPPDREIQFPEIQGNVTIYIGEQPVELDLSDEIMRQARTRVRDRVEDFRFYKESIRNVGISLWNTYLGDLNRLKKNEALPALVLSPAEVYKYKCCVNSDGKATYLLSLPFVYNPQWIVERDRNDNTLRYKLASEDVAYLLKNDLFITFFISKGRSFVQSPHLFRPDGVKFYHYHGRSYDCWGSLHIPERWDGTIHYLAGIRDTYEKAIATINKDSLMDTHPPGMPKFEALKARATLEGEQGKISEVTAEAPGEAVPEVSETTIRTWGERR